MRPGSTLERTGLVREGALLLAIDGSSAERLRGRALRSALQAGARRRATFFSPMQASLRSSPKGHARPSPSPSPPATPPIQVLYGRSPSTNIPESSLPAPAQGMSEPDVSMGRCPDSAPASTADGQQGTPSKVARGEEDSRRTLSGVTDEEASIALAAAMAA